MLLLDPENMAQFIGSHGVDMLIKICSVKQKADTMQVCDHDRLFLPLFLYVSPVRR